MSSRDASESAQLFSYLLAQMGEVQKLKVSLTETQSQSSVQDSRERRVYTDSMNEISREEFNAKLETIEVKMDARVEAVSAKIEGFLAAQTERDKRLDAALAQITANHSETKSSLSSMKTALVVTAVSTVLAIVFGVASFNTALTSNMMAAFQVGIAKSEAPQEKAPTTRPAPNTPPQPNTEK